MSSSRSSKHYTPSYASSPAWSMNTLTGTTASSGSVPQPRTPAMNTVSLPTPPGSARSAATYSGYPYASQMPSTPGAPHMGTVPLPAIQSHALPTPPVSPETSRLAMLSELLVYTGHRSAKLNFNAVHPPSSSCLHPSCNPNTINEPAISTHAPCLVLEIPGLMRFYAQSARGHAVTVREVLHAIHATLSERASQTDYTRLPSENHRQAASASFAQRNKITPDPAGLRRFDLLGGRTTFAGLQRAATGEDVWFVRFI
ncbi:hypothetical protein BC834DRAFT_969731 [Gloeopeniophorella convolvens]|nr:hypothetical protein BC834DRAFT_969731 [Gloeopeniophorella convolvens]